MTTNYLNSKCEGCDSTDTTEWTNGEMLCPDCTQKYTRAYGASAHLRMMLGRVADQFVHTYAAFPDILKASFDDEMAEVGREEMERAIKALQAAQWGGKQVTS